MKRLLVLLFVVSFAAISNLSAANYKLDNSKVDAMFEMAQDANYSVLANDLDINPGNSSDLSVREKDPIVAGLLALFIGNLGIHRFYLGTEPLTGVAYILTCGGCGIVSLIDGIVLLVNSHDISRFVNNPRFFMW